jgi:hypothetical protein
MARSHGYQVGIEAKIEYHPTLEILGTKYESWKRTALNWLQSGLTEDEVEKRLQKDFDIDWAWADSLATEAKQCFDQLTTARELNVDRIKEQIKKKIKRAIAYEEAHGSFYFRPNLHQQKRQTSQGAHSLCLRHRPGWSRTSKT